MCYFASKSKKKRSIVNLAYFIARRIARPSEVNRPGVMVRIATVAVALSLAVMLLSMSVIMGFKREVSRKIIGFAAHVLVTDIRSVHSMESPPVRRSEALERLIEEQPGSLAAVPYATKGGIVRTGAGMQGVLLKGIGPEYDTRFLGEILIEGALPRAEGDTRTKDLLISRNVARKLKLGVGDKVELLFVETGASPRRDRFKVSGIYYSGMAELDDRLAVTDIRNVRRLNGWEHGEVSGYELTVGEEIDREEFTRSLNRTLLLSESEETDNLIAASVEQRYPTLFDWLRTHDVNAAVILTIMLVVALFNMVSVLLILVLERTRMIGLLKALGMTDGQLQRIFLYRAAFIIGKGVLWGNAAALTLCLIQRWGHVVKLDASGYLLSEVPIAIEWSWWLGVNLGSAAVILLLLSLPTYIISYVRPDESIRYE